MADRRNTNEQRSRAGPAQLAQARLRERVLNALSQRRSMRSREKKEIGKLKRFEQLPTAPSLEEAFRQIEEQRAGQVAPAEIRRSPGESKLP